jgi:hypothetical protein
MSLAFNLSGDLLAAKIITDNLKLTTARNKNRN